MRRVSRRGVRRVCLIGTLLMGGVDAQSTWKPLATDVRQPDPPALDALPTHAATDTGLSLTLNLPSFRLDVWDSGGLVRSYPVAVGMRGYRTPRGDFAVTHIEWNPWWNPPDREWARKEHRTPPGPDNPMGKVKMYFTPFYFLHGTPLESSIGHAASHGCVRMRNADAVDLALLLHARDSSAVPRATLDSMLVNRQPRYYMLARPVPLRLSYELAEVRGDSLLLYPDIYGLAKGDLASVWTALLYSGVDTAGVRKDVLTGAVRAARRKRVAIPVDSLLTPP